MNVNFDQTDVEQVWVAEANEAGPTVAIFGGVHGDELTGIEVVKQTLQGIDIETGRIFVALGNLAAIQAGKRHTGFNLNRAFRDLTPNELEVYDDLPYELKRAQALNGILSVSDALLDLHDFADPNGPIFMITEDRGFDVARAIGAPVISNGWSTAEPGGSDYYMETMGRIGICYELGDKTKPMINLERGLGARDRFLEQMGLREKVSAPLFEDPRFIRNDRSVYMLPGDFRFARDFRTFDKLEEGELIAVNGETQYTAESGQVIIFPFVKKPAVGEEAFCLGHEFVPGE